MTRIQTTKPNASLHGFGLSNIKLILNKYHADFVMDYTDGWFQFTGEIETIAYFVTTKTLILYKIMDVEKNIVFKTSKKCSRW